MNQFSSPISFAVAILFAASIVGNAEIIGDTNLDARQLNTIEAYLSSHPSLSRDGNGLLDKAGNNKEDKEGRIALNKRNLIYSPSVFSVGPYETDLNYQLAPNYVDAYPSYSPSPVKLAQRFNRWDRKAGRYLRKHGYDFRPNVVEVPIEALYAQDFFEED